ncbi:MAG: hypothetical protein ACI9DH_000576 [Halioglobus sp.]|jgi:hypothetical protein
MPVNESGGIELWMTGIVAALLAIWKAISMFFRMKGDVKSHGQRLDILEADTKSSLDELRSEIKSVWDKTEQRHNRIDDKLDRIIEKVIN